MNAKLSPSPADKKHYIQTLASALVKAFGKKRFYSPAEVLSVNKEIPIHNSEAYAFWGMSIFCSQQEFIIEYVDEFGNEYSKTESDPYGDMKVEMLLEFSGAYIEHWDQIPELDSDASWLEFGDLFEDVFEGIGDFIEGIFEIITA